MCQIIRLRLIAIILLLCTRIDVYAQKEANIWYYGFGGGLDFNVTPPQPRFDGKLQSLEATAVLADKETGRLLFYSDGTQVWDRLHQVMPNGKGLNGLTTSTQGALIVPMPGKPDVYYLFTLATPQYAIFAAPGLYYAVIDLKLNGGRGDVVGAAKNVKLLDEVSEKLTAVPHLNGKDYWVITHGWNNDEFYVYLLNSNGLQAPAIYKSGTVHQNTDYNSAAAGYLRPSPDGKLLACAVTDQKVARPFELYDFDAATGAITNYRSLGNFRIQYGVSFSPDNSKLYLTLNGYEDAPPDNTICQFDLNDKQPDGSYSYEFLKYPIVTGKTGSSADKKEIIPLQWALQLGPDGKLYSSSPYVINRPNLKGAASSITALEPELNGLMNRGFSLGLPNFLQSAFNNLQPNETPTGDCSATQAWVIAPNPTEGNISVLAPNCTGTFEYRVYTTLGQLLQQGQGNLLYQDQISLVSYAAGCYLIEITLPEKRFIFKVIKL